MIMWILMRLLVNLCILNNVTAMIADRTGQMIQVLRILVNVLVSVGFPENKFQPMIAPTIACDVDTGKPDLVIEYTAKAADSAVIKAPGKAEIAPSLPSVWVVPPPEISAPRMMKMEQMIAAVRHLTILVPTAVPNTFAASFAPKAQPRNNPLDRNISIRGSMMVIRSV